MAKFKKNIVKGKFNWIPMNDRVDKLGLPLPPRPKETKSPLLWIAIDPQGNYTKDIYLVNDTGEALESVIASIGGFESFDDDVIGYSGPDITYKNIENGSAIKIDTYDVMADSDRVLQIYIKVKINGKLVELRSSPSKGGLKEEVLL